MEADRKIQETLDRSEIKDVVSTVNYARDSGLWEELRARYHPDATLATSWFTGTRDEFIEAARRMKIARYPGESQKHVAASPWVRLRGDRAAAEQDLILYQRRLIDGVELDFTTWSRVVVLLEKREGAWRIWKRTNVYEKDRMDPCRPDELPASFYASIDLGGYPRAIRCHCWRNARIGHPPASNLVLQNSAEERAVREEAERWLAGE